MNNEKNSNKSHNASQLGQITATPKDNESTHKPAIPAIVIVGLVLAVFVPVAGLIISIFGLMKVNKLKQTEGKALAISGIVIGLLLLPLEIVFMLGVIYGIQHPVTTQQDEPQQQTQSQQSSNVQAPKPTYIFDVPSLISKNIDQVRQTLGAPKDKTPDPTAQQASYTNEWDNTFEKDNKQLLVTYTISSKQVVDLFIDAQYAGNKDDLYKYYNVKDGASNYKIVAVKAIKDPSVITGYKIVPQ